MINFFFFKLATGVYLRYCTLVKKVNNYKTRAAEDYGLLIFFVQLVTLRSPFIGQVS